MSILSDKYKIPEPTIKNMIQDGVISCKYMGREEIFILRSQGKSINEIADSVRLSPRHVRRIISEMK